MGPAGRRTRCAQLHELPVHLSRRRDGYVLRRFRVRVQPGRAAVPPARAGTFRAAGQRAMVRQPRLRARDVRAAQGEHQRRSRTRSPGAPRAPLRVPGARAGGTAAEEHLIHGLHRGRERSRRRRGGHHRAEERITPAALDAVQPAVRRAAAEGAGARGGDLRTGVPLRFDLRLAHQRARQLPDLRCGADRKRHGAEPAAADHGRPAGQPGSRAAGRGRVHPAGRAHPRFRRIARAGRGQRHPARRCQRAARLPAGRARPGRARRPAGHRREGAGADHGRGR